MGTLNRWKPMHIGDREGFEGLIGIEECTEYDLGAILQQKKVARKSPGVSEIQAARKRKAGDPDVPKKAKKAKRSVGDDSIVPSKSGWSGSEFTDAPNLDDVKSWSAYGLPSSILKALALLKFTEPTQIQALTLPPAIMGKRDILGAAETGSGKTLAFGLPILYGILKSLQDEQNSSSLAPQMLTSEAKPPHALVLTPTRELAVQIKNHMAAVSRFTSIKIALVVGGMSVEKQERILAKAPEIVVGTPGRLWELIQQGNVHLSQINEIKFLAIDETDRMIERGHFQELDSILEKINADEEKRKCRQNFVFSATLTLVHELPQHLVTRKKLSKKKVTDMTAEQKLLKIVELLGITNPKCVDITQGKGTPGTLTECRITCSIDEKDYYLYYFLQKHPGRTLVFCNSIGCVKRLSTIMGLLRCNPLPLHASMQQRQRLKNLDRFKENENGLLVATDVAARGLDIPCVEHVIHYQTPRTSESYVHRSGRTARATRQGITVLMVEPSELQSYLRLCRTLGKEEDIPTFPVQENFLDAVKSRVKLARELDKLELQLKKSNSQAGWMQKAADEMDVILDDESHNYDQAEMKHLKRAAELKRKDLNSVLTRPLFPKGFSGKYPGELMMVQRDQETRSAVEVMRCASEDKSKVQFKKPKFLFKPKITKSASALRHGNGEAKKQKKHKKKLKVS